MDDSLIAYQEHLKSKLVSAKPAGFEVSNDTIHPMLFDWQREVTKHALLMGRYALFEERGLGKTIQSVAWANNIHQQTHKPVLIVCPLAVASQTIREGQKIDVGIEYVRSMDDVKMADEPIHIIYYDMLKAIEPDRYGGIVLDECFVGDTLIDTKEGTKRIEDIEPGEYVYNALGLSKIKAKKKRYSKSLVLTSIQGRDIISSENHPFFTHRGWVKAKDLKEGDYVIYTSEAMRMVRQRYDIGYSPKEAEKILQSLLFGEMENETAGNNSQGSFARSSNQEGQEKKCLAEVKQPQSKKGNGTNKKIKSYSESGNQEENIQKAKGDQSQAAYSGREWQTNTKISNDTVESPRRGLDTGICPEFGETAKELPDLLQNRHSESSIDDSDRGRRLRTRGPEAGRERQKEGNQIEGARVDSVTIYKSDDPIFARYRDETDRVALYDLEIEGHPSFSVNGLLVHNSSILKAYTGKTKTFIVDKFVPAIPYRLFCSATPAPNDHLELGNHAEGLSVMNSNEMIARWFVNSANDPGDLMIAGQYKLKPHGADDFWRWLSTWAICISTPSDIGFSDDGYIRPPLDVQYHLVEVDHSRAWDKVDRNGQASLFLSDTLSATNMWAEKRETYENRCYQAKEIDDQYRVESEYHIIWCDTNDESKLLKELIPDSVEVKGSDSLANKEAKLDAFSRGDERVIITKSKIAGMGLNWQHCARQTFISINYKWEEWYQAVGRTDRFGNERQTIVNMIYTETEGKILEALRRKGKAHAEMQKEMNKTFAKFGVFALGKEKIDTSIGNLEMRIPEWLK